MTPSWLSQLAPAHAPPPPGWWPPAPGWWLLACCCSRRRLPSIWWWRDPYRRSRRAALRELRAIRAADSDLVASARAIESLLRRFAIAVFGVARVARLTGDAWLAFVAAQGGMPLAGEAGGRCSRPPSAAASSDDRECWIAGADAFVRQARCNDPTGAPGEALMLHLAWPWMALLLPLPWIMLRMRRAAGPNGAALYLPFAASVASSRRDRDTAARPAGAVGRGLGPPGAGGDAAAMARPAAAGAHDRAADHAGDRLLGLHGIAGHGGRREPPAGRAAGCRTVHRPAARRSDRPDSLRHPPLSAGAAHDRYSDGASVPERSPWSASRARRRPSAMRLGWRSSSCGSVRARAAPRCGSRC